MAEVEDAGHHYEVFMQPVAGRTLFSLGPVARAGIRAGGAPNPSVRRRIMPVGFHPELRTFQPLTGPARVGISGGIARGVPEPREVREAEDVDLSRFLQLPEDLDPRIPELAHTVAGDGDLFTRVSRLRRFLRDEFTYELDQANGEKPDPLAGFLFEDRRGHCEYFATAFAVMLRSENIPARVVGGFLGGLWDDSAEVAVFTAGHAHAWVEWFIPGEGWVTDDATPAALVGGSRLSGFGALWERLSRAWDDYVLEYNLITQWEVVSGTARALFGSSGPGWRRIHWRRAAAWFAGIIVALVVAWTVWVRWSHRTPRPRELPLGRALRRALERLRGAPLPESMTLREGVDELDAHRDLLDVALAEYERQRFAGRPPVASRQRDLVRSLRRLST
jgi:transglutaminase-like putative cysteine protease